MCQTVNQLSEQMYRAYERGDMREALRLRDKIYEHRRMDHCPDCRLPVVHTNYYMVAPPDLKRPRAARG